jgi:AraC-like DNA-binding protein
VVVDYRPGSQKLRQREPGDRWTVLGRFHLHAAGSADLVRLAKARELHRQFPLWRSALLSLLGEAYHQLISRADHAAPPAMHAHQALLEQVRSMLDAASGQDVTVRQLAQMTRLSERYLNRLFRQYAGQPIHQYLTGRRMHQAMELCRGGKRMVKEIALQLGYKDPLYFSRAFHKFFGMTPTEVTSEG